MDKTSAQRIVRETFKASFDRKRFRDFVNELCNGFDESKVISSMGVPHAFSDHIKSCQRLGTFESADGELADVLIVHLTESFKLERTRTALRDFVAHKLKLGDDSYKEAGLVAFVAPGGQSWRFSYVRMEYETKRDPKTGKIKSEERLTPARRYSYLVGEDEQCHTAQTRFLSLLQNTSDKPSLAPIEAAFSVESVSKDFFEEYKRLFDATEAALAALVENDKTLRADFETKHVSTADFAKKLLGQIVFLYFIQKKGWLGVAKGGKWGDGPRNFLRQLFDGKYGAHKNFFNDILEPLFYDTLATDRGHEAWCEPFQCRIPFLNGGLFEPLAGYDWDDVEIALPNTLLTNRETNKAGDIGTGILDVFDRFNFTVIEDEPLEKEVAIDPEMLGKVFENLIEENRRKGRGTFYTPREIVHYMCQESLINYLDTALNHPLQPFGMVKPKPDKAQPLFVDSDEAPKEKVGQQEFLEPTTRVLVPREDLAAWIGQSDQFAHYAAAIAAGTKGDHYPKPPASIRNYAREIDELLRDITVCDPAVGSGAFLVGMMTEIVRARMALTPYFNDIAERTAYHFKRRAIQHSLYGVDIDPGAVEIAKLRLWLSLVVDEEDVQQIKPLPNLDYKIVVGNSLIGVEKNLFNQGLFNRLEELKPKFFNESDRKKKAHFKKQIDDLIHELTNGREVFDYEIYFSEVFHAKQGFDVVIGNPPYGADFSTEQRAVLLKTYKHQSSPLESYMLFVEKGHSLNRQHGVISYIVPNTWLPSLTFQKFRRFLTAQFQWRSLLVVQSKVFAAVVDTNVFIFEKRAPAEGSVIPIYFFGLNGLKLAHQLPWNEIPKNGDAINIVSPPSHQKLFRKIKKNGVLLKDISNVFNGVKPFEKGKGKPPQTAQIMRDKPFVVEGTKPVGADWMPLLRGSLIQRYATLWNNDSWIKYGEWLAAPRDPVIFEAPGKIFVRQTGDSIVATLGKPGFVARNNLHIILPKISTNLLFVLGVLNSKVINFAYCFINPEKGEALAEVKKNHVEELPLPKVVLDEPQRQKPIIALVDRILAAKQRDADADTSALEREIDELVYALYGLTPDEIALIEAVR